MSVSSAECSACLQPMQIVRGQQLAHVAEMQSASFASPSVAKCKLTFEAQLSATQGTQGNRCRAQCAGTCTMVGIACAVSCHVPQKLRARAGHKAQQHVQNIRV